jgi:tetratricopeptide (TPR) repeat protein
MQLSSVYGQVEDFPNALAIMQLAHAAGLLTEDSEYRRLADLLVFNEVPYRGAQILTAAIEQKAVQVDAKLYEKLANCWLAAGEYDKAVPHLQRAAEMADSGDLFVRLGEVQVQRQDWPGAENALQKGIDKGKLKDVGNAHLWMGIALYSQDKLADARSWFQRASNSEKHRQTARGYLQAIEAKLRS